MRPYNIVSGILLILPIIDFAVAAPVTAQDKCQACIDVVRRDIPEDVITVLEKRVEDPLDLLWEKYFQKPSGKPEGSSASHTSPGSTSSGPDRGSTDILQAPAQNSASSTKDPLDLLWNNYFRKLWGKPEGSSAQHASSSSAPNGVDHGSTGVVQAPVQNSASSTANQDHASMEPWSLSPAVSPVHEDHLNGPLFAPASSEFISLDHLHGLTEKHMPNWHPNPNPNSGPSGSPVFKFSADQFKKMLEYQYQRPWPSTYPLDEKHFLAFIKDERPPEPGPPNPRLNTKLDSDRNLLAAYQMHQPPPPPPPTVPPRTLKIEPPKGPEDNVLQLDHQSLITDTQSVDPAALYAMKGKAKESRRVSSAARDFGNVAQRELQPVERSLDPGESGPH